MKICLKLEMIVFVLIKLNLFFLRSFFSSQNMIHNEVSFMKTLGEAVTVGYLIKDYDQRYKH